MQVLLLNDVRHLGHLGDVVNVAEGYARNYLIPQRLGTEPTEENIAAIAEAKKKAAEERARRMREFKALAEKMVDVSVTIEAQANEEGTLYGSVGPREIAAALHEQGHAVREDQIALDTPIRSLDNRVVKIEFTDEITAEVKVWVVRTGETPDAQTDDEQAEHDADHETDEHHAAGFNSQDYD